MLYLVRIDFILVFSRFSDDPRNMRLFLRHKIIIFSNSEQDSDGGRVSRECPPRNYLIFAQEFALSRHFLSHPILSLAVFFLSPLFFFLLPFLTEKAFSSPPLLRDLRPLRGSSRIRASPHPPYGKQRRQGRTQEFEINIGRNNNILHAQSYNLKT